MSGKPKKTRQQIGRASRNKGKRGELMAAKALSVIWPGMARCYNQSRKGSDAPDIDAPACPVWIEVKFQKDAAGEAFANKAYEQALKASAKDGRPVLVMLKKNRMPHWQVWYDSSTIRFLPGMRLMPSHGFSENLGQPNCDLALTGIHLEDFVRLYEKDDQA